MATSRCNQKSLSKDVTVIAITDLVSALPNIEGRPPPYVENVSKSVTKAGDAA